MKKRLMRGLALTLICLLAMTAPSEAALSDTILLNETDDGVEVSVKLAETTEDKIFSLSISFQIDYTEGDGKGMRRTLSLTKRFPVLCRNTDTIPTMVS